MKRTQGADQSVPQPMRSELVIKFKIAKALELTIAPVVMMRAERVVK